MKTILSFEEWAKRMLGDFDFIDKMVCCGDDEDEDSGCVDCPLDQGGVYQAWNEIEPDVMDLVSFKDYKAQVYRDVLMLAKCCEIDIDDAALEINVTVIRNQKGNPYKVVLQGESL